VDALLLVIATVLVGRAFASGSTLVAAELAALALLLPTLVVVSRLEDRTRSALVAALLGTWLAAVALAPAVGGTAPAVPESQMLRDLLASPAPAPAELAGKAFSYLGLAWLLAGAGLYAHVAAGITVLLVLLLVLLQAGIAAPEYGWADLALAIVAGILVWRWAPRTAAR